MRAISRLLVRHWCEEDNHSGYRLMVLEAPDLEHARPGGVPFSKTSIVLWTRQLAKLVESRAEVLSMPSVLADCFRSMTNA